MADIMTTYVKVVNLTPKTFVQFKELFKTKDGVNNSYVDNLEHFTTLYGPNNMTGAWMSEHVGAKWMTIEFGDDKFSEEVEFVIESGSNVPTDYLQKLINHLTQWDKEIALYGSYEEETFNPIGAFVYAFDYDDIEDYEGYDSKRMWDDEDYCEEIKDELHDHRDSMYESYLDVKSEREDEEEDDDDYDDDED